MSTKVDAAIILHAIRTHKAYCVNTYAHAAAKGLVIAEKIVMEALTGEPMPPGDIKLWGWDAWREPIDGLVYVRCPYCDAEEWVKDFHEVWNFCPRCGERVYGNKRGEMTFGELADLLGQEERAGNDEGN